MRRKPPQDKCFWFGSLLLTAARQQNSAMKDNSHQPKMSDPAASGTDANASEIPKDSAPEAALCPVHRCALVTGCWCPVCRGSAGGRARSTAKRRAARRNGFEAAIQATARRHPEPDQYYVASATRHLVELDRLVREAHDAGDWRAAARIAVWRERLRFLVRR